MANNLVIIAGARRCGTTSMYNYLARHPMIGTAGGNPHQEIHFFDCEENWRKGVRWYISLFGRVDGDKWMLDKSPTYLQAQFVPGRIESMFPGARIIVILRDKVSRTYSDFHKRVSEGYESRTFAQAVSDEALGYGEPQPSQWWMSDRHLFGYIERSNYELQLSRWRNSFRDEQMLILRHDDLVLNTSGVVDSAFDFLGVKRVAVRSARTYNRISYPQISGGERSLVQGLLSGAETK